MYTTLVHVYVKKNHIDDFIEATRRNHEEAIKEPGNRRFDVLRQEDNHAKFVLYEAFDSKEAAHMHKETKHYMQWRDTVADWMAEPRLGIVHECLFPAD